MIEKKEVDAFYEQVYERILGEVATKDDLAFKLGDGLDVKASILLVIITGLGTQVAYFLDKHVPGLAHFLLICSSALLALATISAVAELWPRDYITPIPETTSLNRANELYAFYAQHEDVSADAMLSEFTRNQMGWAQTRIEANQVINKKKSEYLQCSFYLISAAMAINIAVLAMRLF